MTMFDDSGHLIDRNALQSIQLSTAWAARPKPKVTIDPVADTKTAEYVRDDDGTIGGTDTFHGDGRIDVNVHGRPPEGKALQ